MIHFCNRERSFKVEDLTLPCSLLQISSFRKVHDGWAVRNLRRNLGKSFWLPIVSSLDWAASAARFFGHAFRREDSCKRPTEPIRPRIFRGL
jgi:hypothetical protein